jgi:hypothetical protein
MRMAMEKSGIELTTDYVKTKLLQEEYNPKNRDSESGSALSLQHRAWNRDTTKYHGKVSQGKTRVVNSSQSLNFSRYEPGPCFICNQTGHKAANCHKNPNRKNLWKGEEQNRNQDSSLLAAMTVTMNSDKWYLDSGATAHMTNDKKHLLILIRSINMQLYLFSFLFLHYMFRLHAVIFRWFFPQPYMPQSSCTNRTNPSGQ